MQRLIACLLLIGVAWADPVGLADLFANKAQYEGKTVTVSGTVKGYYEKPEFAAFLLMDGGKGVSVVTTSKGLANEAHVTVTGPFSVTKKVHGKIFSNVVEAEKVEP